MPYNGAGNFVALPPPQYPAVAGDVIRATYFNAVINDILAGLSNAVTRDGQSPPTGNLPMAGKRHTGVADAVATDQYASYGQLLQSPSFSMFLQRGSGAVARILQEKLRDTVSLKDFGAVGDGVADDTLAVQTAINAVASFGGVLFVPVGIYRLTGTVTLKPNVSILGEQKGTWGANPTPGVVFRKAFTTGPVFFSPNTQRIEAVTYENFYIEGNKGGIGGNNGNGIEIQLGSDLIFRRVWANQCPSSGFVIGQGSTSYHNYFYNCYAFFNGAVGFAAQSDWMRFVDCWADGNYIGISFPPNSFCGSNARIERCHFEEWQLAAIAIQGNPGFGGNGDNRISNCVFYSRPYNAGDAAHGIFIDSSLAAAGSSGNHIRGNKFVYQNTYGPTKSGKYAIYFSGGSGGSNIIEDNQISAFDIGVNILPGSVRNTIRGNYIDSCTTGVNNTAALTVIKDNIFTGNTSDLSDIGGAAQIGFNYFSGTPVLSDTSFTGGNNSGSRGLFTPTLLFGGNAVGIAYANRVGRFEKNGKIVTLFINITLSAKGTSVGTAEFTLPIAASNAQTPSLVWIFQGGSGITQTCFGFVNPSSNRFTLLQGPGTSFLTNTNFTDTTGLIAQVVYESV